MSSDRYRAFFLQSTVGMSCLDLSEQILEVNPAFCRLLGYSETELVGIRFHHLVHPADVQVYQQAYRQLLTKAVYSLRLEQRLLQRSGQAHWVLARFSLLSDETTGESFGIAGTFEDIDQRQRLETDLRRRAQRDSLLAEFTQGILRSLDLNQILQSSAESARRYLCADRVIVYRFDANAGQPQSASQSPGVEAGTVIIESIAPAYRPMLHQRIVDPCFHLDHCLQPYRDGKVSAVRNIYNAGYANCYIEMLSQFQVISNLVVPILDADDLWGLLVVQQCSQERTWQLDEISLIREMATQMAIAIKQSELYAQTQQEALRQQAINDLSRAILSVQSLETFFNLALHKIKDIFQADRVAIAQYRPDSDRWLIIAEEEKIDAKSFLGEELKLSPTQLWGMEQAAKPAITSSLEQMILSRRADSAGIFSTPWVITPLVIKSGLWGGLMVAKETHEVSYWTSSKLELAELLSHQLALAIQQNLFYKQWQRRAEQQSGLHRLVNAIRESLDLTEIFDRAAQEARGLLQVERVLIWEFNPNRRVWILRVDECSHGEGKSFTGLELPDEYNPLTHTLKQGNILRCSQAQLGPEELVQVLAKTFPGAWLLVPLKVSQMTWGMLHCIQKDNWQDWQEDVASAVADKLAIAVQQSLLYEQVQAANHQLRELALIDSLTQVPNRRYFDDYLHQEWRRTIRESTSLSLILCDVDFFKPYNDTYGHQKGDETLRAIADVLKSTVQRPGDVVARYGGEEFGIILPATTSIGAARIAEEIQRAVSHLAIRHDHSEIDQYVTLSLGIAAIQPQQPLSPEQIVALADRALYQAKRQGRNRYCIHPNASK